jgi:predicted ATPase
VRELAERGLLQGQTGAYVSTADVSEAKVPATLQATIAARIDRLDPKAKRTLSAAAVVGSRFGLDLLNVLDVEPVARWPDHPDHRAVAGQRAAIVSGARPAGW